MGRPDKILFRPRARNPHLLVHHRFRHAAHLILPHQVGILARLDDDKWERTDTGAWAQAPAHGSVLLSSVFCLLSSVFCLRQILNRSSNALLEVVCFTEPVSRSTFERASKNWHVVKASFGVTRAVMGCMHS